MSKFDAFCESPFNGFIESPFNVRGCEVADVFCVDTGGTVYGATKALEQLWSYDLDQSFSTESGNQIRFDSKYVYVCGARNSTWTGSSGANASLWRLTRSGAFDRAVDMGGEMLSVFVGSEAEHVIVCGTRNNAWPGATGQATVWKVDMTDGSVDWAHDTGASTLPTSVVLDHNGDVLVSYYDFVDALVRKLDASDGSQIGADFTIESGSNSRPRVSDADETVGHLCVCTNVFLGSETEAKRVLNSLTGFAFQREHSTSVDLCRGVVTTNDFSWWSYGGSINQVKKLDNQTGPGDLLWTSSAIINANSPNKIDIDDDLNCYVTRQSFAAGQSTVLALDPTDGSVVSEGAIGGVVRMENIAARQHPNSPVSPSP